MKKLFLLCAAVIYFYASNAQPLFQTSLEAGFSLPVNSNGVNQTNTGKAIQFGNHLDYLAGNDVVKVGLGGYIGYLNALSADNSYKENAEAIADKYRLSTANLVFNSSAFKSTHILLGPVASFGAAKYGVHIWAKAGYGLNEPSRYSVQYKDNGVVSNIYINQSGEHKNGFAYSAGVGLHYALSGYAGLKLDAHYFSTQTDQVNYNFDREKGLTPMYFTAANQFIQLSAGLQFTIGNPGKTNGISKNNMLAYTDTASPVAKGQKIKTKSNIKNDRVINAGENDPVASRMDQKIKTKSNIKNDRMMNMGDDDQESNDSDSLFFSPEKIEIRTKIADRANSRVQLQAVENYLTGFVYSTAAGNVISQCGSNAMPGEPIPGIDVRLRSFGATTTDVTARTNRDGSFSFNNISPGDYKAEAAGSAIDISVNSNTANDFKVLDVYGGSCGSTKENYVLMLGDKTYVEVLSARDASSGLATGKKHIANVKYEDINAIVPRDAATGQATGRRMHKPYRVVDTDFEVNINKIISSDGKLYAEVIAARDAASGMASGRRTIITGDVDGDGINDYAAISPRDAASGLSAGKRMHKPFVITKEIGFAEDDDAIVSPRDAASGMPNGKRMHKPFVITKEIDLVEGDRSEIISPRDASSGLPTGKRMHKPFIFSVDDNGEAAAISSRDASSGMASGRRQYQPLIIRINPDENSYSIVAPRDAASGMATGKRMHKPFVITKELGFTENGDETVSYRMVWGDPHEYLDENITPEEQTGNYLGKKGYDYYKANSDMASVANNPLYQGSGTSGVNPVFESKDALHVTGGNGKSLDIFIPSNLSIVRPVNDPPVAEYSSYAVGPIKWMAPESIAERKGITEKGIKKNEALDRKGWDGSVKGSGKSINTSEDNIGSDKLYQDATDNTTSARAISTSDKRTDAAERKGWDGTVKGGSIVKEISRVNCTDGTCALEALLEVDGVTYEAVITGILKTKHDTAKNSIGNIR